jgi:hypothetical protein
LWPVLSLRPTRVAPLIAAPKHGMISSKGLTFLLSTSGAQAVVCVFGC